MKCTRDVPAGTGTPWIRPSARTGTAWRVVRAPLAVRVMTVACQPVANCSDRTKVAGLAADTRTV